MRWWFFLLLGGLIAIIRIFLFSYYQATGIKLIPELMMVIGFGLQIIFLVVGFAMWKMEGIQKVRNKKINS